MEERINTLQRVKHAFPICHGRNTVIKIKKGRSPSNVST
jgi:hypothetical protein